MIYLGSMYDKKTHHGTCIAIVRGNQQGYGDKRWQNLAPSKSLFGKYVAIKDAKKADGTPVYDRKWFDENYVGEFISDIVYRTGGVADGNESAIDLLNEVYKRGKTEDLTLLCYCSNESLCHRSIVGGILLSVGANIECDPSYVKYGEIYRYFESCRNKGLSIEDARSQFVINDSVVSDKTVNDVRKDDVLQVAVNNLHKESDVSSQDLVSENTNEYESDVICELI